MRESRPVSNTPLLIALVLSLLLHIPLLVHSGDWFSPAEPQMQAAPNRPMVARMVRRPKKKTPVKKPDPIQGTIVKLPEPDTPKPAPKNAKFLAEKNHIAKKDVKAKRRDRSKVSPRRGAKKVRKESKVQSKESPSKKVTKLARKEKEKPLTAAPKEAPLTDLGQVQRTPNSARPPHPSLLLPATNEKFALANIQTQSGRASADDALLNVEDESDETFLNAREFRYWQFFDRVKSRVRDNWNPGGEYRRRDPTGRVYGVADRYTLLRVTLTPSGDISRIGVIKKAGAEFLDEEAWRAFREAGPFPNPPEGLVGDDGQITFEFGFLFEISSGPKFFWKR